MYLTILNDIDASSLTQELNESINQLKVSSDPESYPNNDLSNIILLIKVKDGLGLIVKESIALIPILEQAGMLESSSTNWLGYLKI